MTMKWTELRKRMNIELERDWHLSFTWKVRGCFYCGATVKRLYLMSEVLQRVLEGGRRQMLLKFQCLDCGAPYEETLIKERKLVEARDEKNREETA